MGYCLGKLSEARPYPSLSGAGLLARDSLALHVLRLARISATKAAAHSSERVSPRMKVVFW